jgi:uncharacterized protein
MTEALDRGSACAGVVDYILLKVASRCNIACTYCYWFKDADVYGKPKVISPDLMDVLRRKIVKHVCLYGLKRFSVLFHGGEPLLCRREILREFSLTLRHELRAVGCDLKLDVTTNGLLIDDAWTSFFKECDVGVTISIDGPQEIHDRSRVDFKGRGTFSRTLNAISRLRKAGLEPGILSVCNPRSGPREIIEFLYADLGFDRFDILIPDACHNDNPASISNYYIGLYDAWKSEYASLGVRIRILDNMMLGLLGGFSESESIGYGPIHRLTVLTDGAMETLDVLRVIENGFTKSCLNIRDNDLQDIETDPLWREVLDSSLNLHADCEACSYHNACGGGHIATRWNAEHRFDSPSVYCADIKLILGHIWADVRSDLHLAPIAAAPSQIAV